MRYTPVVGLLAVVCAAAPAHAQGIVSLPGAAVPVPLPDELPPVPIPPPASVGVRPPTLGEFAESFHPAPGRYEVVLLNPATGRPTKVCFALPCDRPCKIKVHSRSLEFSYGLFHKVTIRFKHDGEVTVRD